MSASTRFWIRRFRVIHRGKPVYDQTFHEGVNMIRGHNGSGKSTIADFIFYILGGEFNNWKTVPSHCNQVQAEIVTNEGTLTLKRDILKRKTPVEVFFGPFSEAEKHALEGWESYPLHRQGKRESFSQIMFRASGIPEAQSEGSSNITMNQLLRLLYADQRTPAAFLFRYESFDNKEIREAVGDLICGLSVYELYETDLELRRLTKIFDDKSRTLSAILGAMDPDDALVRIGDVEKNLTLLDEEYGNLSDEIESAETLVADDQVQRFLRERTTAAEIIRKTRDEIKKVEGLIFTNKLEIGELESFVEYLSELSEKLSKSSASADLIGNIEFTHCPACLTALAPKESIHTCIVCGSETDPEQAQSRHLQIKLDLDIQLRESRQLLDDKHQTARKKETDLRGLKRQHQSQLSDFAVRFDMSTSPRDSFVAERYQRLGQIDGERTAIEKLRNRATEIEALCSEKEALYNQISTLKETKEALERKSETRRRSALSNISRIGIDLLARDLDRQDEFRTAQDFSVTFGDNAVLVDGELNFAESSNVIVKNSAILGMFLASLEGPEFYHPRFLLMDNVEDKGMEDLRSQNFQKIIVECSNASTVPHQIIFTTSNPNPDLETDEYVIGPHYTKEKRTLSLVLTEEESATHDHEDKSAPT